MAKEKKSEEQDSKPSISLKDLFSLTIRNWKWVALSIIVCTGLSAIYLKIKNPVYKREASVIIKDEQEGFSFGGIPDLGMADMSGLLGGNSNFENELTTFRSPDYMEEVVKKYDLQTSYRQKKKLKKAPLYGSNLSIDVQFPELAEDESAEIEFEVLDNDDIKVSRKMKVNGEKAKLDKDIMARFNVPFMTPAGTVVIRKTDRWGKKGRVKHNAKKEDQDDRKVFYVNRMSIKNAIETYQGATDVSKENDKGATVINLTVKDDSKERGVDVLTGLIDVYNKHWSDDKNEIADNTLRFIDDRLLALSGELGDVEATITDYKTRNLIVDEQIAGKVTLEKGAEVDKKRIEQSNNLEIAKYLKEFLQKESNQYQTLPVNIGVGNLSIEQQIAEYNKLVIDRNVLVSNSSDANPLVSNYDQGIAATRRSILTSLDNQIATLNKSISLMQKELGNTNTELSQRPEQFRFLRSQGREQLVKEQLYLFLLQKKEENQINRTIAGQNIKILRRPNGSDKPYSPNKMLIVLMGMILGAAIPVGIIYFVAASNTKLRSRKDVEQLGIPTLGEVPKIRRKMPKEAKELGDNILVHDDSRDMANEAFRVLRTNIGLLSGNSSKENVIMMTSFLQNSGKTFVTMNLAVACAMKKRVLVVDCDLRKGSASSYIGSPSSGLTDFLNGTTDSLQSVIVCDSIHENLCVLPVGSIAPNPTELLESDRFKEAIDSLRDEFDYIFIDCPPSEMMADAQIINNVADRTIFILRAGKLDLSMLPVIKQYYVEKKYNNISLVLNDTEEVNSHGYGTGYEQKSFWQRLFRRK